MWLSDYAWDSVSFVCVAHVALRIPECWEHVFSCGIPGTLLRLILCLQEKRREEEEAEAQSNMQLAKQGAHAKTAKDLSNEVWGKFSFSTTCTAKHASNF